MSKSDLIDFDSYTSSEDIFATKESAEAKLKKITGGEKEMRKKLFRGKRINNGEWVEGFYLVLPVGETVILSNKGYAKVIPETVGQYTGLTDKNGKKIFEGDICQVVYLDRRLRSNGKHYDVENVMIEEVVFEKGTFCFKTTFEDIALYRPIGFEIYEKQKIKYFEVIGNIFDNPELLEVINDTL